MFIFFSLENVMWILLSTALGVALALRFPQRHIFLQLSLIASIVYLIMLLKVTLGPLGTIGNEPPLLWIFFPDQPELNYMITHWILNFVLFFPLGVFMVINFNWHYRRTYYWILGLAGAPLLIEGTQEVLGLILPSYALHVFAWDDIVWNSLGGLFGFFLAIAFVRLSRLPTGVRL